MLGHPRPPPAPTATTHPPKSTRVIPANMKQAVRDDKENKLSLVSRELAFWNLIVPIEYITWGLIKLFGGVVGPSDKPYFWIPSHRTGFDSGAYM